MKTTIKCENCQKECDIEAYLNEDFEIPKIDVQVNCKCGWRAYCFIDTNRMCKDIDGEPM